MGRIKNIFIAILSSALFTTGAFFILFILDFFDSKYKALQSSNYRDLSYYGDYFEYGFYVTSGLFFIFSIYSAWSGSKIIKKYFWLIAILAVGGILFWFLGVPKPIQECPNASYLKNIIFIYQSSGDKYRRLPDAYTWNFSCTDKTGMYNGKSDKFIYMSGVPYPKVENADVTSFESLSEQYAKDKNNIYLWGKILKNADVETFELIKDGLITLGKDKNNVYLGPNILEGISSADFSIVGCDMQTCYIRDQLNVYWTYGDPKLSPITGADIETFKYLEGSNTRPVAVDKNHVYYRGVVVENLSPRNFKEIGEGFYKNRTKIYGAGVGILEGIDMETFECVPNSISPSLTECHDKDYIYNVGGGKLNKKPRIK